MYTTNSETKAAVVERFNRTLKSRMWRYFTHHGNYRYMDIIGELVRGYNASYHRSIGISPDNVNPENSKQVLKRLFPPTKSTQPLLQVGDQVRISKLRRTFDKGYLPNWTDEVFTIDIVLVKQPPVYRLRDLGGELIKGTFYVQELQKIKKSGQDLLQIDRVIDKRGKGEN